MLSYGYALNMFSVGIAVLTGATEDYLSEEDAGSQLEQNVVVPEYVK